jgi:hypothetical protein
VDRRRGRDGSRRVAVRLAGNLPQPFSAFGVAAGLTLVVAVVATGSFAAQRRTWLAPAGVLLVVLGYLSLLFLIGFLLLPLGAVLFAVGLVRAGLVTPDTLGVVLGLCAAGVAAAFFAAAVALGVGIVRRSLTPRR